EARRLVDALGSTNTEQMAILVAGASTEVRQSRTANKAALRRALESARVTDAPTRLADALRVAESLTRGEAQAEVHLFSDGAVPDLGEFETRDLRLVFHRVGQRARNAGVVSLDVRPNPEDPARRAIFAGIANYAEAPVAGRLELRFEDRLIESRNLVLPGTNTTPVVFVAAQAEDGVFTVRLDAADDLAVDNEAHVVSLLPQRLRVRLVSAGNRFLEKALAAAGPNVEVETTAGLAPDGSRPDLTVLDDVVPAAWPEGSVLAINVQGPQWFEGDIGTIEGPPIVDWRNTHPLLRFVGFDNVQVARARAVKAPGWGVSLVDSPQSPLVVAGELGRQRIVWVGFNTLESTWPLRISFPIFIANVVDWLNPASARAELLALRPGDPFRWPLAGEAGPATLTAPDGSTQSVEVAAGARELVVGATGRQGVYRVALGTNTVRFAASLLDAAESNLRPRESLAIGRFREVSASPLRRASLERWRWFALAGLAVLLLEWWWFHRRTA
ncbi:MAG: vWA domain-containing protein, partial [Verrucomicrobiota bacterium]